MLLVGVGGVNSFDLFVSLGISLFNLCFHLYKLRREARFHGMSFVDYAISVLQLGMLFCCFCLSTLIVLFVWLFLFFIFFAKTVFFESSLVFPHLPKILEISNSVIQKLFLSKRDHNGDMKKLLLLCFD